MATQKYNPGKVYVEKSVVNHPNTKQILSQLPSQSPIIVEDISRFIREESEAFTTYEPQQKPLLLAYQKSGFLKKCPGTQKYICCGYQILNPVNNCEINCSYCILQGYLNSPFIIVYVNINEMLVELKETLATQPERIFRIGTGELADSLSTDFLTGYSRQLVRFFSKTKNAVLELKTKTTQVENFLNERHNGRTICAWSLNTPFIIEKEESFAPTLNERLKAADLCQKKGFKLAFHFDPMIYYQDWEPNYKSVVDEIFTIIKPENITWISLGALRYPPFLDSKIRENHPDSKIVYGEMFPGIDGKMRYFKPLRIKMFSQMYQWIKEIAPEVFVYLCMESSEVWEKSFGWTPKTSGKLKKKMDDLIL
jgi:spore photoproduct lyase